MPDFQHLKLNEVVIKQEAINLMSNAFIENYYCTITSDYMNVVNFLRVLRAIRTSIRYSR
jgi:hypothetical protein